jgi:hypothetical protein
MLDDPSVDANTIKNPIVRAYLERLHISHQQLSDKEAVNLRYALSGWHVVPRTPAGSAPITARVWLAAALGAHGRYLAPDTFGHPANLEDGGRPIDSVILMALLHRHILTASQPGWDDDALAAQLGLPVGDITRAQAVLHHTASLVERPAPLGPGWWMHVDG